jgi:8-oxoguanine deaminase
VSGRWALRGCDLVATFDDAGTELRGGDVVVDGTLIEAVGVGLDTASCDRVIDGTGLVVLPGLVNAHQHLYQGALRAIPHLERALIGPWLGGLGAVVKQWLRDGRFEPDAVQAIAAAVLAESLLGGVTTVADQHYFHPAGSTRPYVEATIAAAGELGVRFHACRGTLTLGPDPDVVQRVDDVVAHCAALIASHHDPRPGAMVRVALAPCGVHVDQLALFDELAALAADHDEVRLHTHLYEHVDTDAARERYGMTPWELIAAHGWAQPRTWLAHVVDVPIAEIDEMVDAGVAVAHLIAPDLRMGWGCAPVREFLAAGATVGFGTTGSASNDGANLLGDLRVAALAHRTRDPEDPERWLSARELLRMATRGSAACLGRDDIGMLAPSRQADLAAWDLHTVDRIGVHDPLAGLVMTGLSTRAAFVAVGGDVLVERGEPTAFDVPAIAARARAAIPPLPNSPGL